MANGHNAIQSHVFYACPQNTVYESSTKKRRELCEGRTKSNKAGNHPRPLQNKNRLSRKLLVPSFTTDTPNGNDGCRATQEVGFFLS